MASFVNNIKGALASSRYQPVIPALPVERYVGPAGRFQFGIPWPWVEDDSGKITDATGADTGTVLLAQVSPLRTDGLYAPFIVWAEDDAIDVEQVLGPLGRSLEHLYGARAIATRRILLAGHRAVVNSLVTPLARVERLHCEWFDKTLTGEFRTPVQLADAYLPHWDTILGTWSWR